MTECNNYLQHFGIKGQKWGVRRFENPDGTLTEEGKKRYGVSYGGNTKLYKKYKKERDKLNKLNDYADVDLQKKKSESYAKKSDISKKVAIASVPLGIAGVLGSSSITGSYKPNLPYSDEEIANASPFVKIKRGATNQLAYERDIKPLRKKEAAVRTASIIAGVAGLLGGATASYIYDSLSKSAEKRTTAEGHSEAVKNAKQQCNRMMKMFSNTPYQKLVEQMYGNLNHSDVER